MHRDPFSATDDSMTDLFQLLSLLLSSLSLRCSKKNAEDTSSKLISSDSSTSGSLPLFPSSPQNTLRVPSCSFRSCRPLRICSCLFRSLLRLLFRQALLFGEDARNSLGSFANLLEMLARDAFSAIGKEINLTYSCFYVPYFQTF